MNEYMNVGILLLLANWVYVSHFSFFFFFKASTGSTLNKIQLHMESKSGNDPHKGNNRRPAIIMAANFCAATPKYVHSPGADNLKNIIHVHSCCGSETSQYQFFSK